MTYVMNMKEVLCMFVTTAIKCHSLSYDIFNAYMRLFEISLLWDLDINQYINVFVMTTKGGMTVLCTTLQVKCYQMFLLWS